MNFQDFVGFKKSPESFQDFLYKILKENGLLNDDHIHSILVPENILKFRAAFTDSSYVMTPKEIAELNSKNIPLNYEYYETLGDVIINSVVVNNIVERLPSYRNTAWITRLRHTLISGKILAKLSYKHHFGDHIRYGGLLEKNLKLFDSPLDYEYYLKLLEDVFEAFLGCLRNIITAPKSEFGLEESFAVVNQVAYNIIGSFINTIDIASLKYEDIFDPVSRLKELYNKEKWNGKYYNKIDNAQINPEYKALYEKLNRTPKEEQRLKDLNRERFTISVLGWPNGTENKSVILVKYGMVTGSNKDDVKNKASLLALEILKKKYNIYDTPIDRYINVPKKTGKLFDKEKNA